MSLIFVISQMAGGVTVTPSIPLIPMIVFSGESNSGGFADNADATVEELAARPALQILNNTSLVFEDLDIGVNNLLGHSGLINNPGATTHGWELELANRATLNEFSNPVYLVKTGQGGSTISQWGESDTYYTNFKTRIDTAITLRSITGTCPFALFYQQGINDSIAGTATATWKAATIAHFEKIRTRYGADIPIIFGKLPAIYSTYNTAIDELVSVTSLCWSIETTDLGMKDANHYNYTGMKTMSDRMIDKLLENYTI